MENNKPQNHSLSENEHFSLKLFIAGASPNSVRAIENLKSFCQKFLEGRFDLEIIDIYQQPSLANEEQIIALPLLVRKSPAPEKRFIGDMSETKILLKGLGLNP